MCPNAIWTITTICLSFIFLDSDVLGCSDEYWYSNTPVVPALGETKAGWSWKFKASWYHIAK